jgi:8-hydroxy-5-deazaflavin:NADPH oxidoreductase
VIGGTGQLGGALARRWARSGYRVIIGSRDMARARQTAADIAGVGGQARGTDYSTAASEADVVVVTVPFASQGSTLTAIRQEVVGKLVIDTTVPLMPPKVSRVQLPAEGSAAVRAQALLGESCSVVSAFHNVAAHKLMGEGNVDCDVLVFGDQRQCRQIAIELAGAAGLRGLHAGPLVNSVAAEALTSILIFMNKQYAIDGAGIRVTGALRETAVV